LQDQGDPRAPAGRPSLLSPGEQAEPDRQRILTTLDGTAKRPAPSAPDRVQARRGRRGWAWGGAAVAVLAIGATLFAVSEDGEHAAEPVQVAVAPASGKTVVTPAAAPVAPVAPSATAETSAPHLAVTPAVISDSPEAPPANPLADMAPVPAAVATRTHAAKPHDTLTRALEKPASKAHADQRQRKAEQTRPVAKKAKDPAVKRRAQGEADSDVVLLAALMSHMQPPRRKATLADQLQICKQYNAVGEEQCRARVCSTADPKEAACKKAPAPLERLQSDS
jgi:type IV secretory pathway VirB10-like protein